MDTLSPFRSSTVTIQVEDADEEIFLLYTELQRTSTSEIYSNGLGHIDSKQDTLELDFEVTKHWRKKKPQTETISVELHQDKTALRTRKGDTGSVLWTVSVEFAKVVLGQRYASDSLLDYDALKNARVLELGSGTGFLAIILSSLVKHYTVTDIDVLLPLIRKNITINAEVAASDAITVAPLDWLAVQEARPEVVHRLLPRHPSEKPDLIIAADCIYHPNLILPIIRTMSVLASSKTTVLVLAQLREVEVLREFLTSWLGAGWNVSRIDCDTNSFLGRGFVAWIGRQATQAMPEMS